MPARRWSPKDDRFEQKRVRSESPTDERGCRRDIRSNGWIELWMAFVPFEAGAAEETGFLRSLRIRSSVRSFILAASAEVKSWS